MASGTTTVNLRFAGQYFDQETSLHYNYFRYYDPQTGRYITSDPFGLWAGMNTYHYTFNNPLYWIDPLGLASLVTDMGTGTTTFNPRPEDPGGQIISIPTSNDVTSSSDTNASGPFWTPDIGIVPSTNNPNAYGPDGSYIDTGDPRGRDIHGGGSCLADPLADRQGWCSTLGCTRGQNEDVQGLAERIRDFQRRHPGVPIPYQRIWSDPGDIWN